MPAKAKVTKEMIVDAAFAVARETGADHMNVRTVSERLNCSTQPVMYHFATMEALKRAVYAKADRYHSEYLMNLKSPQKGPALGIGSNYIRFAIEEPHLFRFLFQSNFFNGTTLLELNEIPAFGRREIPSFGRVKSRPKAGVKSACGG